MNKKNLRNLWRIFTQRAYRNERSGSSPASHRSRQFTTEGLEIAPDDPIVAYFQSASKPADVDDLSLDSPALRAMKATGTKVIVPLVSQGELTGLLKLGPHLSQQEYSADDYTLLDKLATQVSPAVRVAQLVYGQQAEARERERLEQELRIAQLIQQTLLPKEVPQLRGWQVSVYYQPAREVGGDFYDFISLPDGRLGLVVGDVAGKGVPAALVMATTRSILRAAAPATESPAEVLGRVNKVLYPDIPPIMFVTCLYASLDLNNGLLWYANAGHDLPYLRHAERVSQLQATGLPLGVMPGISYEERETVLEPGDSILFYSDGLVEAHNHQREMFGLPRLGKLVDSHPVSGTSLVDLLLGELARFTESDWEQEDDITLLTLQRVDTK